MKLLITGADGQLGQELVRIFSQDKRYKTIPTDSHNLDITNKDQVNKVLEKERPNIVIHCAAWTNVDAAADDPEGAMEVNGKGTSNVCEAAKKIGARVIYFSTNEVFDESKSSPYTEEDEANPITPYGKSKEAGENNCLTLLKGNCLIIRTSWLYGPASRNNFPNKILKRATEQGFLKVVGDELSTPTYTPDLAVATKKLIETNASGIFHLVNEGQASRYDWAKEILKEKKLKIPIDPINLDDFERPSKPPKYSVLSNRAARKLGIVLRDWREANKEYIQNL